MHRTSDENSFENVRILTTVSLLLDKMADEYNKLADHYNHLLLEAKALEERNIRKAKELLEERERTR